ncbi:SAS053 family DNA gyrase inhibitor [Staphylococcus lutrae]|uniref:SAS053 family DNA gyrase inhibitor n=1 Tax=Staphylococcus lutrae TaxID=155085 RepID=UPI00146A1A41|nr:SAS053 family protein [Staphylococcus lutrae]
MQDELKQSDNTMVDGFEDVVELGKEMEQISEQNDDRASNQSQDKTAHSSQTSQS